MKKINITMMIFLSAICLMFGMNNVKANNYDMSSWIDISQFTLPNGISDETHNIIIFQRTNGGFYRLIAVPKSVSNYEIRDLSNPSGTFPYIGSGQTIAIFSNGTYYNVKWYDTSNSNSYTFGRISSSSGATFTAYKIIYCNTNIRNSLNDGDWFNYAQSQENISITSNNENGLTTFSIDYSQFLSNPDYRFLYGFDDLAMNDVTNDLVNGIYSGIIDFDDIVIARVVDSNGNTIVETEHRMSYGLKDQLVVHFHNSYGNDFISFIYSDQEVTQEVIANTPQVNNLLFSGDSGRVAIEFYQDETLETEWSFNGTWCASRDFDVYIKWSGLIPEYTTNIYAKDEKIWFNINFTRWDSESSDIVIFATETTEISNATSLMNRTYTYGQYTNHTIQDESVFSESVIELKFGYIVDNRPKIFLIRTISVNNLINNLPQATQEEVRLVDEYHKTQLGLDSDNVGFINKFINSIQVPIQAITDLTSYMFGKCNIYIKSFLISIFTIIIIAAIIKFIK